MKKKGFRIIKSKIDYKNYLMKLFQQCVTAKADKQQSLKEKLMAFSLSCGRSTAQAQREVDGIINTNNAVMLLITNFANKNSDIPEI